MEFVHQPSPPERIGDYLTNNLAKPWTAFRAAVAFVKRSGTRHLASALTAFARTRDIEIIAGIDHGGTSTEGLQDLLDAVTPTGRVIVFHNRLPFTFHPKVYLFKSSVAAEVMIGSGNLTEGGLFTNYEAAVRISLDLDEPRDVAFLRSVERTLDAWADLSTGTARVLDNLLLARLTVARLTPSEADAPATDGVEGGAGVRFDDAVHPFAARAEHQAPVPPDPAREGPAPVAPSTGMGPRGFVMTLQQTDAGSGQTSPGTSRRSPELFVPIAARDAHPSFWGWPNAFLEDPEKPGKRDRPGVRMRLTNNVIPVHMWYNPDKRDLRLRNEALRSAGRIGDILRIEKAGPTAGYDYDAEVIPRGAGQHAVYLLLCRHAVRNSEKRYGYY
jgi:HKD family nuclease